MTDIGGTVSTSATMPSLSAYNDEYFANLVARNLSSAQTGDEFYAKLVELKNEQKKTLLFMQELYTQKQALKEEMLKSESQLGELRSVAATYPATAAARNTADYKYNLNTVSGYETAAVAAAATAAPAAAKTTTAEHSGDNPASQPNFSAMSTSSAAKPPLPIRTTTVTFQPSSTAMTSGVVTQPATLTTTTTTTTTTTGASSAALFDSVQDDLARIERMWDDYTLKDDTSAHQLRSIEFNRKFEKKLVSASSGNSSKAARSANAASQRRGTPKRSSSAAAASAQQQRYEWFPRVTVPEPFAMTIRAEQLQHGGEKQRDRLARQLQEERERRMDAELRECRRQFRAAPVPAHVSLPLYEQRRLDEQLRKQRLKQMGRAYMEKTAKPFRLTESASTKQQQQQQQQQKQKQRPSTTKRVRRHSFSEAQLTTTATKITTNKVTAETSPYQPGDFVAQPLPNFYYNDELLSVKAKEAELFKQMQSQMRAIELLRQSRLPHNMELQQTKKQLEAERDAVFLREMSHLQRQVDNNRRKSSSLAASLSATSISASPQTTTTTRKSHDVPDYDELYKRFMIELEWRKAHNKKNTRVAPFLLQTEVRAKQAPPCAEQHEQCVQANASSSSSSSSSQQMRTNHNTSMTRLNKSLSASMDALPFKGTEAQQLRESVNKQKLNEMVRKELQQEHIDKFKKMKEKKLHDQIQERIKYDPKEERNKIERQTRRLRLEQQSREEEYEKQLTELNKSVEARKLQIEQLEEANLKKALEKKYQDVLRRVGLNETDLKKSTAGSATQVARPALNGDLVSDNWVNE